MNAATDRSPVFELKNVTKEYEYDGQATTAVRDASLQGYHGQLVLLLGPSGSGKTTLLTLAAGLLMPTSGETILFGQNVNSYSEPELQQARANRIGFIFQNFLLIDPLTIEENIQIVLLFGGQNGRERRRGAMGLLQQLKVEHLAKKFPPNLSQGEKQRVALARAIANHPDIVIADEPTASLETTQGFQIITLLHSLARNDNKCVLVASHDLRLVDFADVVVHLKDGEILQLGKGQTGRTRAIQMMDTGRKQN